MKKIILTWAGLACFTAMLLSGCTSGGKVDDARDKVEAAKDNATEAKEKVVDAQQHLGNELNDSAMRAQKTAEAAEWKSFKADAQEKIKANNDRIGELRKEIKKPGTTGDAAAEKKIAAMELQNKAMETRIEVYDKDHSNWQKFKQEFSSDLEGLGQALKNFTVNKQ
jgi:uncharacterized protein YeaO (DUF488 family)